MNNNTIKYNFILPIVWLNILFGNQLAYPLVSFFGQLFNWILLANILLIVFLNKIVNNKILFLTILLSIFTKFLYIIGLKEFNIAYLFFYSLIFILFSKIYLDNAFALMKKQLLFFLKLSIPIMFLQLYGFPQFLQNFNTLYVIEVSPNVYQFPEFDTISLMFKTINIDNWGYESDTTQFLSMQARPPGLLHSSAMQAPLVLATSIFLLGNLLNRKFNFSHSLISLAVVLTGAKIALFGFSFILFFSFLIIRKNEFRKSVFILFICLLFYLLLYYLFFPLAYYQNFSFNSLNGSLFFRLIDFLNIFGVSFVSLLTENFSNLSELSDSYEITASMYDNNAGSLSGIVYLFYSLPILLFFYFFYKKKYLNFLKNFENLNYEKTFIIKLSFIWVIIVLLATPLLGSNFFSLFVGFSIYPIITKRNNLVK